MSSHWWASEVTNRLEHSEKVRAIEDLSFSAKRNGADMDAPRHRHGYSSVLVPFSKSFRWEFAKYVWCACH